MYKIKYNIFSRPKLTIRENKIKQSGASNLKEQSYFIF